MIRKIYDSEVESIAQQLSQAFYNYPLYKVLVPNEKRRERAAFYMMWLRMWTRRKHTYLYEEHNIMASFSFPGEKETSAWSLILNPRFFFGALCTIRLGGLWRTWKYSYQSAKGEVAKCYNPQKDVYIKMIANLDGHGKWHQFLEVFNSFDNGTPIYAETHSLRLVKLYETVGFRIVAQAEHDGVTTYAMRRE